MFRLLGFLIGSTIAITAILFLLGVPEFHFVDAEIDSKRFDEAVEKLQARQQEHSPRPAEEPEMPVPIEREVVAEEALPVVPVEVEVQWHSFWNPFRSEIAAQGFVSQLEEVTGLDYRIVKVKAGVYEVAFAYSDDEERRSKLALISSATGLDVSES